MWTLALSLAKRFWPAIVGTLALLAAYLWHVGEIKEARADERQKVTLAYQKALQDVITKREERLSEVHAKYEAQINRLSQSVAIELRGAPIRMCNYSVSVPAPEDTRAPVESAGGESTVRASRNLRPELVRRGEVCEQLRQQLIAIRALQQ